MGKSEVISEPSVTFARNVDWNLFKVFHGAVVSAPPQGP
jgi:hypothetical protein